MARRARLLWLNYPNNPTGAVASLDFFREAVSFARSFDLIICHDAPYTEITFDGYVAPSFLQAEGAREVGIEFHSLSKTYNMTGWRLGWASGNAEVVKTLGTLKSNLDSGVFQAVQYAGIAALTGPQDCIRNTLQVYRERRDIVVAGPAQPGLAGRPAQGDHLRLGTGSAPVRLDGIRRTGAGKGGSGADPGDWIWSLWRGMFQDLAHHSH